MKKIIFSLIGISFILGQVFIIEKGKITDNKELDTFLTQWHKDAANADYNSYFEKISEDGHYIGTDATENWDKKAFAAFSKPYFDKGKAWDFKAVKRNIYFSKDGNTAWFDELLDTWMKGCRGSGVLEKNNKGEWKIKHYVLSMTIPNEITKEVLPLKATYEDALLKQ
jgi:hypothetical protein